MASTLHPVPRSYIDPERLYTLRGFQVESGIARTRMNEAARWGLRPTTIRVGKRVFIRGRDAIEYIERLATEFGAAKQ